MKKSSPSIYRESLLETSMLRLIKDGRKWLSRIGGGGGCNTAPSILPKRGQLPLPFTYAPETDSKNNSSNDKDTTEGLYKKSCSAYHDVVFFPREASTDF